jgi:DnaJ domain/Domain of unknown function (DUF4399)
MDQETAGQLPDYYAVLGVSQDADPQKVERAYEKLARKYQPDPDKPPLDEERMRSLDEAFDVLDVPTARASYDQALAAAGQTPAQPRRRLLDRPAARMTIAAGALCAAAGGIIAGALLLSGGSDGGNRTPRVAPLRITAPLNGATVASPITIEVASTHLIAAPELNVPNAAHYHVFVDKIPFTAVGQTIPMGEEGIYHFTDNTLAIDLAPGFHTIIVALGDNSHIRIAESEAPAVSVDVIVAQPTPGR